jgi:hypothetical protein
VEEQRAKGARIAIGPPTRIHGPGSLLFAGRQTS